MDDPNAETATTKAPHPRGSGRDPLGGDGGGRFLPGTIVAGRYRMIGLLGREGMGEVYRADDLKLGQPVALKFLPTDVERDPERLERFLNEVRVSLKVTHPNVCRAFDVGQIDQRHFLSMEFVDGEDLGSLLPALEAVSFTAPFLLRTVWPDDPQMHYSGEALVFLDRHGRLASLRSIPPQQPGDEIRTIETNWPALFTAAGLDESTWTPADSQWTPLYYTDRRWAWVPRGTQPVPAVRIEAASFRGRPVAFSLVYPWTFPERDVGTSRTAEKRTADLVTVLLLSALMLGAAVMARRNLRLDRVDRKGAWRLGVVIALLSWIGWLCDAHHVASIWELYLVTVGLGGALFYGALVAMFYMALEPQVRRTWPSVLVSWSRLLAGDFLNPLVARDVLIGCVVMVILGSIDASSMQLVRSITGILPQFEQSTRPFLGGPHLVAAVAIDFMFLVIIGLLQLFLYFVVRRVVRLDWAAIVVCGLIMALPNSLGLGATAARLPFAFVVQAAAFLLLARVGLVALIAGGFVQGLLVEFPVTWPPGMWYSAAGYLGLAVSAALVLGAFRIVMKAQGRPAGVESTGTARR